MLFGTRNMKIRIFGGYPVRPLGLLAPQFLIKSFGFPLMKVFPEKCHAHKILNLRFILNIDGR